MLLNSGYWAVNYHPVSCWRMSWWVLNRSELYVTCHRFCKIKIHGKVHKSIPMKFSLKLDSAKTPNAFLCRPTRPLASNECTHTSMSLELWTWNNQNTLFLEQRPLSDDQVDMTWIEITIFNLDPIPLSSPHREKPNRNPLCQQGIFQQIFSDIRIYTHSCVIVETWIGKLFYKNITQIIYLNSYIKC